MRKTRKILIAVSDSPRSENVASFGAELGRQLDAEMALVSIVDSRLLVATDSGVTPVELSAMMKDDLVKNQQILTEKVFNGATIRAFVDSGKPSKVILRIASEWKADLPVLGAHNQAAIAHIIHGSVADQILRNTSIPLLVVPLD